MRHQELGHGHQQIGAAAVLEQLDGMAVEYRRKPGKARGEALAHRDVVAQLRALADEGGGRGCRIEAGGGGDLLGSKAAGGHGGELHRQPLGAAPVACEGARGGEVACDVARRWVPERDVQEDPALDHRLLLRGQAQDFALLPLAHQAVLEPFEIGPAAPLELLVNHAPPPGYLLPCSRSLAMSMMSPKAFMREVLAAVESWDAVFF